MLPTNPPGPRHATGTGRIGRGLSAWARRHRTTLGDLGIVLPLSVLQVVDLTASPHPPQIAWWWPAVASVPATCALWLRRRAPWAVLLVMVTVAVALNSFKLSIGSLNLGILVAVYAVCSRGSLVQSVAAGLVAMAYPVSDLPFMDSPMERALRIVGAVVNLIMVIGWARAMRLGRLRAAQLERSMALLDEARDQRAADAAVIERARIAREFHDIVSHNLSVVALRAGVARALIDRDQEHARQTLQELECSSRAALSEMRHLLAALRGDGSDGGREQVDRQPTPTLAELDALVDSVRGGAVSWTLDRRGQVRELGSGVEMTAYRIVQEAVTNVLKHAGTGRARVLLDYGAQALRIEVSNETSEPRSRERSHSPGHGLIGLRERVALLGGTLTAHPISGGFHLEAVLPCAENSDPGRAGIPGHTEEVGESGSGDDRSHRR